MCISSRDMLEKLHVTQNDLPAILESESSEISTCFGRVKLISRSKSLTKSLYSSK